ncbi:uncharacterized protein [Clinocottus analis]|uniref:uncharacterized protein n=1 Tax=Clinocottus analis TaxID=304258 RepID=UPI0035C22803
MAEGVCSGEHFVEKYQADLIKRVSNIKPILDEFLHENIIKLNSYDEIHSLPTSQKKMTALFSGPLQSSQGKALFYKLLNKHEPYLIDELKRMEGATTLSVKQQILKNMMELDNSQLGNFPKFLQMVVSQRNLPDISLMLRQTEDRARTVALMMQTYGYQSVDLTRVVVFKMRRADQMHRVSLLHSGFKEKHLSEPTKKEATISVMKELLETLEYLSLMELNEYKMLLPLIGIEEGLPRISRTNLAKAGRVGIVKMMMKTYDQHSVEVTKEVLKKMNRTDLVKRLSKTSLGLTEASVPPRVLSKLLFPSKEPSVDEQQPALSESEETMTSVQENLLEIVQDINDGDLEKFKHVLQYTKIKGQPKIPSTRLETADRADIVKMMMKTYKQQTVEVIKEVLKKMNRTDLVERLSDISSSFKRTARSLDHEDCGCIMVSSDWTKLEPEVNGNDADEAPTYR